jgi:hypothetical protein
MALPGGKYLTAFTGGTPIPGFKNVGKIAVDTNPGSGDYSLGNFVGGVAASYDVSGYVIITDTTTADVVGRPTGNNSGFISQPDQPTYWVSPTKDDAGFLYLVNKLPERSGQATFSSPLIAATWLRNNGYWTSYVTPVLSLDAGNTASYSGTGSTWTDTIGGLTFNLVNNPTYSPSNGGRIQFSPASGQYAECSTSLPSLNQWTVSVWHFYTGQNTGTSPCIVTEHFTGGYINYMIGNGSDTSPDLQTGFWNPGWVLTENGYTLTPGNWYYIVGTYDGNTLSLYVNNTLVESTSGLVYTPQSSNPGIFLMSRWDNQPSELWGGYLATVDIYDDAINSTKVTSIWNSTKSRFGL